MTAPRKARQYQKFTSEIASAIVNARRVGASLRKAAQAAGATWEGFLYWRARGREWNEWIDGLTDKQPSPNCERYARFARDIDQADATFDIALHTWVAKGAAKDGRLALDIIKRREGFKLQQELAKLEREKLRKELQLLQLKIDAGGADTLNLRTLPTVTDSAQLAAQIFGSTSAIAAPHDSTPARPDPVEE